MVGTWVDDHTFLHTIVPRATSQGPKGHTTGVKDASGPGLYAKNKSGQGGKEGSSLDWWREPSRKQLEQ